MTPKHRNWDMPDSNRYEVLEDHTVVSGPWNSKKAAQIDADRRTLEFGGTITFRVRPVEKTQEDPP